MAVTTAAVVVAAGATVAAAQAQKSAAKKAGAAFDGVGQNLGNTDTIEGAVSNLMGGKDNYDKMRQGAIDTIMRQQRGELSETTQRMLSRRAVESGVTGLGPGAVGDVYSAYLGISSEDLQQQGFENYRAYLAQMTQTAENSISNNYSRQYNAAAVRAGVAQQVGAANAGMWNGIASIAGSVAGGGFGAFGSGGQGAGGQGIGYGSMPMSSGGRGYGGYGL